MNNKSSKPFGGEWTARKLGALDSYLKAYTTALKKQPFNLIYIDAFAGAGETITRNSGVTGAGDDKAYREGSPLIAVKHKFDRYIFIEKDKQKIQELEKHINEKVERSDHIEYLQGDANEVLPRVLGDIPWEENRAVAFVDPFATQVKWTTIEAIAETKAIDLWLLFPAMAANRMLIRHGGPDSIDPSWQKKLTDLFGTSEWREAFYRPPAPSLFGDESSEKDSYNTFLNMSNFVTDRLKTIFAAVNKKPLILTTTSGTPLFLFCFAASNPKGAPIAVNIANHIIRTRGSR